MPNLYSFIFFPVNKPDEADDPIVLARNRKNTDECYKLINQRYPDFAENQVLNTIAEHGWHIVFLRQILQVKGRHNWEYIFENAYVILYARSLHRFGKEISDVLNYLEKEFPIDNEFPLMKERLIRKNMSYEEQVELATILPYGNWDATYDDYGYSIIAFLSFIKTLLFSISLTNSDNKALFVAHLLP